MERSFVAKDVVSRTIVTDCLQSSCVFVMFFMMAGLRFLQTFLSDQQLLFD